MLRIGIVGASGFIGKRATEVLQQQETYQVYPIVRRPDSLADWAQRGLIPRQADALDTAALTQAFAGCDVVIHSVLGSPSVLRQTVVATYKAATAAHVKRLIYLSSASVHSQTPRPGTTEETPLSDQQPIAYNNAKVQAEQTLKQLRQQGTTEIVILRPMIVFGPGSGWVRDFADRVLKGTAYWINHGQGVCNSIYIDNLVHAIRLAMTAPDIDGEAFLLTDHEHVTWADLYCPILRALGKEEADLPNVDVPYVDGSTLKLSRKRQLLERLRNSETLHRLTRWLPMQGLAQLKKLARQSLTRSQRTPSNPSPTVTPEMALLFLSQYKFPDEKSMKQLGYEPQISFSQGCDRSIDWLADLGYPIHRPNR